MFNMLSNLSNIFSVGQSPSFLSGYIFSNLSNVFALIGNFFIQLFWTLVRFLFGIMDAFEYMINHFLGIGTTVDDIYDMSQSIEFRGKKYVEVFVNVFKNVAIVSIILLIVFTIIAIIRQEYEDVSSGFNNRDKEGKSTVGNSKAGFLTRLLRSLLSIFLLPLTMIFVITGVNSILTSFQNALQIDKNMTVAGQVLATSTYDSNRYRNYANANQRVPIVIEVYDSDDIVGKTSAKVSEIKAVKVQKSLKNVATTLAYSEHQSFADTVTYKNNKIYNNSSYPDYYEKFICTAEQYQVMADFIDYAQNSQISYYIKSMDDPMIDWGYVDDVVYDGKKLNITYRDASNIDKNSDTYTISYKPEYEAISPISDAMDSIMAMLGVGDYEKYFNIMERDESGKYQNLVKWANEKALVRFSSNDIDLTDPDTWTDTDEIIFYEFNRGLIQNDFENYKIEDFKPTRNAVTNALEGGVEFDVYQIVYRDYNDALGVYEDYQTIDCIIINGNYYHVEESDSVTDNYGNPYYLLKSQNVPGSSKNHLFESDYSSLKEVGEVTLKTSGLFNINNPDGWTYLDQVLMYEYYRDLSSRNDLSLYPFSKFKTGVDLPVYEIGEVKRVTDVDGNVSETTVKTRYYVLINGTYYVLNKNETSFTFPDLVDPSDRFLTESNQQNTTYYNYDILIDLSADANGFNTTFADVDSFIIADAYNFEAAEMADIPANYVKYENFNMHMSPNFDYANKNTWSYRDYFLFYLYINHSVGESIEFLQETGMNGVLVWDPDEAVVAYQVDGKDSSGDPVKINLDVRAISRISEQKIVTHIDSYETINATNITTENGSVFVSYNDEFGKLQLSKVDSRTFDFSSQFDALNVSTWTIEDLILYYFSTKELICDVDTIENSGYTALVYETEDGDKLYKFGAAYNSANPTKTLYLSEKNVLNNVLKFKTFDEWLETNVYTYLLSCYNWGDSAIIATESGLIESVLQNYESQIKEFDDLVDELVLNNWSSGLKNIVSYTYSNPIFSETDMSTWTNFDLLVYALTGNLTGFYSSPIVESVTGEKYITVGGKYINISDASSPFNMDISIVHEDIKSSTAGTFESYDAIFDYYEDNYLGYVFDATTSTGFEVSSTVELSYTIPANGLPTNMSKLDVILTSLNGAVYTIPQIIKSNIYTKGNFEYILVNDHFIQISSDHKYVNEEELAKFEVASYKFEANLTLSDTTPVFNTSATEYTYLEEIDLSFNSLTANSEFIKDAKLSELDSAIYHFTKSTASRTYSMFESTLWSGRYMAVEAEGQIFYIECANTTLKDLYTINTNLTDADAAINLSNKQALLSYVYEQNYASLFIKKIEGISTGMSVFGKPVIYNTDFDINDISTWSPLEIILYQNSLIQDSGNIALENFDIKKSADGLKTYFYGQREVSSKMEDYYIDITNICNFYDDPSLTAYKFMADNNNSKLDAILNVLMLNVAYDATNEVSIANLRADISEDRIKQTILANEDFAENVFESYDVAHSIGLMADDYLEDASEWTWLDLIYYYSSGEKRIQSNFLKYYSYVSGATYKYMFNISTTAGNLFYNVNDGVHNLTAKFTTSTEEVTRDPAYETILTLILKRLMPSVESNSYQITKVSFTSAGTSYFYFIKNDNTGNYCGIYNLPAPTQQFSLKRLTITNEYKTGSENTYKTFSATGKSLSDLHNWGIFDFILYYAYGSLEEKVFESNIYQYSNNVYFKVNDNYINLTALGHNDWTNGEQGYIYVNVDNNIIASNDAVKIIGHKTDNKSMIDVDGADRASIFVSYDTLTIAERVLITTTDNDELVTQKLTNLDIIIAVTTGSLTAGKYTGLEIYRHKINGSIYLKIVKDDSSAYYIKQTENTWSFNANTLKISSPDTASIPENYSALLGLYQAFNTLILTSDEDLTKILGITLSYTSTQEFIASTYEQSDLKPSDLEKTTTTLPNLVPEIIKFSPGFNFGDYSTWTVSDFLIYYAFVNGYYTKDDLTSNDFEVNIPYINEHGEVADNIYEFSTTNFQTFVNNGGAPAYVYYYLSTDEYGDVFASKLINFGNTCYSQNLVYFDYEVFEDLRTKKLVNLVTTETSELNITVSDSESGTFTYKVIDENYPSDFDYNNYYFFNLNNDEFNATYSSILYKNTVLANLISSGEVKKTGVLNFKLGTDFLASNKITDPDKWTLLEYLVIYEYSRFGMLSEILGQVQESNLFANKTFDDLLEDNNLPIYSFVDDAKELVALVDINGNLYNLVHFLKDESGNNFSTTGNGNTVYTISRLVNDKDGNGHVLNTEEDSIVSAGYVNDYSFKALYEQNRFLINKGLKVKANTTTTVDNNTSSVLVENVNAKFTIPQDKNTISYVIDDLRYYRSIQNEDLYHINLNELPKYEMSARVQNVGWPQKLMNDMQVLYPDLNWNTLLATDSWLDTLGDYTSAYTNGMYEAKGNSSNITAAGLVLSEFFLSKAKSSIEGYAQFEYESFFDENIIKSLMLAILGEENYVNLSHQAEVFMEMFNTCFASILDDIAHDNNVKIVDGQVDNFVMSVYKSYLATVLLSADFGEYLYTLATRIYAEYTMFESLALASGDYSSYLSMLEGSTGEDGQLVDSFKYATFKDLVKYENMHAKSINPTYTFNMRESYIYFEGLESGADRQTLLNEYNNLVFNADKSINNDGFEEVYKKLFSTITNIYSKNTNVSNKEPYYCYMFEVYYSIKKAIIEYDVPEPFFVSTFGDYLIGEVTRWEIVSEVSTADVKLYLSKYDDYVDELDSYGMSQIKNLANFYIPSATKGDEAGAVGGVLNTILTTIYTWISNLSGRASEQDLIRLKNIIGSAKFADDSAAKVVESSLTGDLLAKYKSIMPDIIDMLTWFYNSENGSVDAWQRILKLRDGLDEIIDEILLIIDLPYIEGSVNTTVNGSNKIFEDELYRSTLNKLTFLQNDLDTYIELQNIVDMCNKYAINYTLAQYGQNYVGQGYDFVISGKTYTFNSYVSAARLAEYVYGGKYLTQFGINAAYTSNDYEGAIKQSKVYDSKDGTIKTKLGIWEELRSFAGELADYTAELYFMSNLSDMSGNRQDGVRLDDYVYANTINTTVQATTPEYLILKYIVEETDLDIGTKVRLIYGDKDLEFDNGVVTFTNLDDYNDGTAVAESVLKAELIRYLVAIQRSDYLAGTYYNNLGTATPSERIHKCFVNVMEYLISSNSVAGQETTETEEEKVSLDNLTLKDFKVILMDKIANYTKQVDVSDSSEQNTARYMTLFNLISAQFEFYHYSGTAVGSDNYLGTLVTPNLVNKNNGVLKYNLITNSYIYADLEIDASTRNLILRLAGLENRPIEELITHEYNEVYSRQGIYDEQMGDVFVVCSYDEVSSMYVPILARTKQHGASQFEGTASKYYDYYKKYNIDIKTSYYDNITGYNAAGIPQYKKVAYPIIAKGIIATDGRPTAIRIEDGVVKYYRTNVSTLTTIDEDAVVAMAAVTEVNSVGFTNYVESTAYKRVSGSNSKSLFNGSFNMKTELKSDVGHYFVQDTIVYSLNADERGGGSIYDNYSAFFTISGQTFILLVLGISSILTILFKATAAVLRRILDIMVMVLIGPLAISARAIGTKPNATGKEAGAGEQIFTRWRDGMERALISVLGYIIAFNVYYMLVSSVWNMTFVSETTFNTLHNIGGLNFITAELLDSFIKYLWIIVATAMIKSASMMLTTIITGGKVKNPFIPAIEPKAEESMLSIRGNLQQMRGVLNKAKDVYTGEALMDAASYGGQVIKTLVPFSAAAERVAVAFEDRRIRREGRELMAEAIARGVSVADAKQAAKQYTSQKVQARRDKKNLKIRRANSFAVKWINGKYSYDRRDKVKKDPNTRWKGGSGLMFEPWRESTFKDFDGELINPPQKKKKGGKQKK